MIDNLVNKIKYKLFGYVTERSSGPKIGNALLSYITSPFTRLPWQKHTDTLKVIATDSIGIS